jgi:hypothetical protein
MQGKLMWMVVLVGCGTLPFLEEEPSVPANVSSPSQTTPVEGAGSEPVPPEAIGEALWSFGYNSSENDWPGPIAVDPQGGVVMTGDIPDFGSWGGVSYEDDVAVWRLDPDGELLWSAVIDGRSAAADEAGFLNDKAIGVAFDAQGGVVVSAQIALDPESYRHWLRRYTPSGDEDWTADVPVSAGSVAVLPSGEIWVAGVEDLTHVAVARYAGDGALLGITRHLDWDRASLLALDGLGQPRMLVRAGEDEQAMASLLRLGEGAEQVQELVLDPETWRVGLGPDGGYASAATSGGIPVLHVAYHDEQGGLLWSSEVELHRTEAVWSGESGVAVDAFGSVLVAGVSDAHSWVVKLHPDGALAWNHEEPGVFATGIAVGPTAEPVTQALSYTEEGDYGLWVGKRSP